VSMEICVLSGSQLNSISAWQSAIDAEGFPLSLSDRVKFSDVKGFLPVVLQSKKTGFECYHVDPGELFATYDDVQFRHEWKYVLAFVWGGDFGAMQAAWVAAIAYARATSGAVFDEEAGEILTVVDAFAVVQGMASRRAEN
jgi:hypothetical protein